MATAPFHHQPPGNDSIVSGVPEPGRESIWREQFAKFLGDDPEAKWGGQMFRISNDMMLVCDSELHIVYHNRAFLRTVGYRSGSFAGFSLFDFFPARDRNDADNAFFGLESGHASGLRIDATMLTCRGELQIDIRVVRSRKTDGSFNFYLVGRNKVEKPQAEEKARKAEGNRVFDGLPVAAWRTDGRLKVTQIHGDLWQALGVDRETIIGEDLTNSKSPVLPGFLLDVDYCDTMAGLSLHSDVEWDGAVFEISVEPFVNHHGKVMGTLGIMRRSKQTLQDKSAAHLQIPGLDPTEPVKPIPASGGTRQIEIGPPPGKPSDVAALRSNIQPRSLASTDVVRRPVEKEVTGKTGPVALAN